MRAFRTISLLAVLLLIAGGQVSAQTLARPAAGLLYQSGFASSTGWTLGTGWAFDATSPAYCVFDPTPLTFEYTVGGADGAGVREIQCFRDSDGNTYMLYGAGNSAGSAWVAQYAKSTDRELTWTRSGSLNIALQNGVGGSVSAADQLYFEKRGSTYYFHSMTAGAVGNGVPAEPYYSRMWTNTAMAATGWTYQNPIVSSGLLSSGADNYDELSGSVIKVGSVYHLFTSITNKTGSVITYGVGHFTANGPNGDTTTHTWTAVGTGSILTTASAYGAENPKVFYSSALSLYVMFLTHFPNPAGNTFSQAVFTSPDLSTWTPSGIPGLAMMHQTTLHGSVLGANILSPIYVPEGLPAIDSNGYVACTYDCDSSGLFTDNVNQGRRGRFAVAEPALNAAHYNPSGGTLLFSDTFGVPSPYTAGAIAGQNGWTQPIGSNAMTVSNGLLNVGSAAADNDIVNSGTSQSAGYQQATFINGADCSIGFIFKYKDTNNFYFGDFASSSASNNAFFTIYRKNAGTFTIVASLAGAASSWFANNGHTCKVVYADSSQQLYFDGTLVLSATDSSITGAGLCGFRNGTGGTGTRTASSYTVGSTTSGSATAQVSLTHSDFVAEYAVEFPTTTAGSLGFDFHVQDANNYQRLLLTYGGKLSLQRAVAGTVTTLPLATGSNATASGYLHYVRVESQQGKVTASLDGEKQIAYTDPTYASGVKIGFYATGAETRVRAFSLRQNNTVTVQGLTAGHTIVPRTPSGLPIGKYTVPSSGIVSFTYPHFPLAAINDNGTEYFPSDAGYIWGGDVLGTALAASGTKRRTQ